MRKAVIACCAVASFSCAPPVSFKSVTQLPRGDCANPTPTDQPAYGGLLDLAAQQAAYVGVTLESHLGAGTVIDGANLRYTTTPQAATFRSERVGLLALLPKVAEGTISFPMNVIGPSAARTIIDGDLVSAADELVLNCSISFVGHVQGGSSFETDTVTFPLKLFRSACFEPNRPALEDLTCGVVQDQRVNCQ